MRNLVEYFRELALQQNEEETKNYEFGSKEYLYQFSKEFFGKKAEREQEKIKNLLPDIKAILMASTLTDLQNELVENLPTKSDWPISDIKEMLKKLDHENLFKLYFKLHEFDKSELKLKNLLLKIFHKYLDPQLAEKLVELAALQYRYCRYKVDYDSDPASRTGFYFDVMVPYRENIVKSIAVMATNIQHNKVPRSNRSHNVTTFFGTKSQKSDDNFESAIDFKCNP